MTSTIARTTDLLVWSAADAAGLPAARAAVLDRLGSDPGGVAELARELRSRDHGPYRGALACHDVDQAVAALRRGRGLEGKHPAAERPLALLFSGVGEQFPGMAWDLHTTQPVFRAAAERCFAALGPLGDELRELLVRPPAPPAAPAGDLRAMLAAREVPQGPLSHTRLGQPAVFVVEHATAELLRSWGLVPEAVLGYSLGEYAAACAAGVLTPEDALRLVSWRAERIEELPEGGMLAVAAPRAEVEPWLGDAVDVSAVTGPHQTVVGGPAAAVAELAVRLTDAGVPFQRVGARHGFHTRTMAPLAAELRAWITGNATLSAPRTRLAANVTGTWATAAQATDPDYWARHLTHPVELLSGLGALWRDVDPVALELGPGEGLTAYARHHPACDRPRLARVQPTLTAAGAGTGTAALLTALGRLWTAGLRVDWARLDGAGGTEVTGSDSDSDSDKNSTENTGSAA
ncbi:acyltransferase domain-containing protein [Actinokineospora bangkokensis]|uniref:Malonyl-CoA:ACP transacylase (MAT) domain-containing protein n=1 Tax=Actinokineospora bangkokensis TaxID=1193682 RepID=A0A1Q9LM00_9PSEU|nr:acyltransferase domain-containing protein [Actinokineospora bangkokensis]OLR93050.1 hypothetical protein BJP25_19045 [Actinokineospora bangkokensis]